MLSFYGQGIATLQVKEGNQVSRGKQGYSNPHISSYCITRVYGDGGGIGTWPKMICWCYHTIRHLQTLKTGYLGISGLKDST